ncbi:hypothetical protein GCM10014713_06840 [Streptomyces purpureus]|uniref:Uncharacterized protein n=2 Tax=Streptomyces purpureus TaxID=1951 RepID=A0A918LLZ4_9ACTN|nr:hypothetical protein GCM10014713_06840 [Streptomyces purpureus]
MSWRSPQTPWVTHEADFTRPIDAAIAPERWVNASDRYTARFDEGRAPSASTSSTRHGRRAGTSSIVGPAGRSRTMSSVIPYTRGTGYPHAARGVIKRD